MQVILRESLLGSSGERIEISVTLPPGNQDADAAWKNALQAIAQHAGAPSNGTTPPPERSNNVVWTKPGLHGKTLKTVHRVAVAIHELTEARRTPNVDNITAKARTSRPPVYNIADPGTPAGQYMAPYIVCQKIGREIVMDLTPKGRQLVSLIRAGKVPA